MISKETFIRTIIELRELDIKMDTVDRALKALNSDFCGFYMTAPLEIVIGLLVETLGDREGWLEYFIFERNWLDDYSLGDIEINGEPIAIENWADVYDFIVGINKESVAE